jgi:deoxyribose-phosphate aldolase
VAFPHGNSSVEAKIFEAREAIEGGATEIDVVINIGKVIQGDYEYVRYEVQQLVDTVHSKGAIIKVIFETAYLNKDQKITLCEICSDAEADYVKTSTGFASFGAMMDDNELMKQHISNGVKIKASGGIRTREEAESYIKAGCQRIGLSQTQQILEQK